MPARVVFDVNFLDRFLDWSDTAAKAAILRCIERGELEVWASLEALEELMGVERTGRRARLPLLADLVLTLTRGKILRLGEYLLAAELSGQPEMLIEDKPREEIIGFLRQTAGGHIPSATPGIATRALELKKEGADQMRRIRNGLLESFPGLGKGELTKVSFEELQEKHWVKQGEEFVRRHCEEYEVPDPSGTAALVMRNPGNFPRTRLRMKAFSLILHRYLVLGERIEDGDVYDVRQMVYLHDCDVFVTDERRLQARCRELSGTSRRVLGFEEFIAVKWC